MENYDWLASESAPKGYPMEIINGTFLYPGQENGLYIPNHKLIYDGWGEPISTHVVGPDVKPLPDRLEITFYSFTEDQFYHGTFDLPYNLIRQRFAEGYESNIKDQGILDFRKLVVGVAPGGHVAVWIRGAGKSEEVFFGQANPIEYDWELFWKQSFGDNHAQPRDEFRLRMMEGSDAHKAIEQAQSDTVPFDKWARLRKHYPWEPRFFRMAVPEKRIGIDYVNGELYFLEPPFNAEDSTDTRPMPKHLAFHSNSALFLIHFDEDEMLEAFEALADGDKRLYLDIAPYIPRTKTEIRLRNEDGNIRKLEKFYVEELRKYDS